MHDKEFELEMERHESHMSNSHKAKETHFVYVDDVLVGAVTIPNTRKVKIDNKD